MTLPSMCVRKPLQAEVGPVQVYPELYLSGVRKAIAI